jgi:hypothetical protein
VFSNFQDLMQRPREGVCLYFIQNVETFKRFMSSKPDHMPQAIRADDEQKKIWKDTEVTLGQFCQNLLFIAGLHEPIRKEVMKNTYDNFLAVYKAALDKEIIQLDNKMAKTGCHCCSGGKSLYT